MGLTEGEARTRLAAARVARLATADRDGQPHLVPVTFAVDGDLIYTAVDHKPKTTANLRRLRNIRENPRVALLADYYAEDWVALWWVRVDGRASIIEDETAMRHRSTCSPSGTSSTGGRGQPGPSPRSKPDVGPAGPAMCG